jgi:predicted site-specific integrase-resolvase
MVEVLRRMCARLCGWRGARDRVVRAVAATSVTRPGEVPV